MISLSFSYINREKWAHFTIGVLWPYTELRRSCCIFIVCTWLIRKKLTKQHFPSLPSDKSNWSATVRGIRVIRVISWWEDWLQTDYTFTITGFIKNTLSHSSLTMSAVQNYVLTLVVLCGFELHKRREPLWKT